MDLPAVGYWSWKALNPLDGQFEPVGNIMRQGRGGAI